MERLFNNQIRPQAQPITSFIQPQQFRRANPSQPSLLGNVSTIVQSQQQSQGSVAGFNQIEQLATSLAPFSKQLTKGIDRGFKLYATSNIEAGYYEEAKNQAERARLQMQINQEKGGEEAAALITQLDKMDPVGASLLREANPWKAIGRRRALAQQAAGQVATELTGDLVNNASELSGIKPGSPELGDRKMRLTQQVYQRFGLTGNELEANYYVTPEVNRQWDKYTQTQSKLYDAELLDSTIRLTGQAAATSVKGVATNGVLTPSGVITFENDKELWAQTAGLKISNDIDAALAQLGGEDRIKAIEKIKQQLTYLAATGGPRYELAIQNVRWGRRVLDEEGKDDLSKRPTWLESRPYELADYTRKALETDNAIYNEEQKSLENKFEQDLEKATAGLIENSPEWYEAVRTVDEKYEREGLRNRAQKLSSWISNEEAIAAGVGVDMRGPVDAEDIELIEDYINNMTYEQLIDKDQMKVLDGMLTGYIERVVGAPNRVSERQRLTKLINDRIAVINKSPTGATSEINNYVKSDLLDPAIAALKPRTSALTGLTVVPQGQSRQAAINNGQRYKNFENTVRGLYQREYQNQLNTWRAKNAGLGEPDLAAKADIIKDTATAVRKSPEFKTAKDIALGKLQPNGQPKPPPPPAGNKNLSQGPIPAKAARTVTPAQASKYRTEPIMDGRWVRSEYTNYANTRKTSPQLNGLARKAGVAPLRFLIEQLNQYPLLDPQGTVRDALLKDLNKNKQSSTPSVPVLSDMDDPDRAPGSWLADMVMPVTGVEIAQVAGLRPLPINRMVRQAGRLKNQSPSGYNAGTMLFSRKNRRRIDLSPAEVQRLLRSDPQFKKSYERQIVNGQRDEMTDKYGNLYQGHDGSVWGSVYQSYEAGGVIQREPISREEVNRRTIERQQAAREAIENWDPIEASAREDFNRLRGGNRSIVNPGALPLADELIQTIGTPIAPPTSQMDRYGI